MEVISLRHHQPLRRFFPVSFSFLSIFFKIWLLFSSNTKSNVKLNFKEAHSKCLSADTNKKKNTQVYCMLYGIVMHYTKRGKESKKSACFIHREFNEKENTTSHVGPMLYYIQCANIVYTAR